MRIMPVERSRRLSTALRWAVLFAIVALLPACSAGISQRSPTPPIHPVPTASASSAPVPAASPTSAAPPTQGARQSLDLTILHTNDVRGEIDPCG